MSHDATKVLMGMPRKTFKVIDNRPGEIEAGLCVHLKDDGGISVASADGAKMGVSAGKDLSGAGATSIVRSGLEVPVLLTNGFTPDIGDQVHINDTTGRADASGTGKTGVNAIYVSGPKTAIKEDGTEVANGAALIDFQGGL